MIVHECQMYMYNIHGVGVGHECEIEFMMRSLDLGRGFSFPRQAGLPYVATKLLAPQPQVVQHAYLVNLILDAFITGIT